MSQESQAGTLMSQLRDRYQLVEDPFSAKAEFFFEGAQRRHNLEALKHLAAFGDLVLFVTGEKGAGKTFLLSVLQAESEDLLRSLYIDCDRLLQESHGRQVQVIQQCLVLAGLSLKEERFEDACSRLLANCDEYQKSEGKRTLIIFDCADKLPRQQLLALCGVSRQLPEDSSLVFLFAGSAALLQNSRLGANLDQDAWWHQVQMKPLSGVEVREYLAEAMHAAGFQSQFELSEQQLEQLVQVGKGLPGRINKIFASVMLEPGQLKLPSLKNTSVISFRVMAVLAMLLVCSFLLVAFQHGLFERLTPVFSLDESATDYEQNDTLGKVADIDASKTDLERAQRLARLDAEMQRHGLALPEGERVSLKDGNLQASEAQLSEERDSASGQSESASIAPVDFSEAVVEGVTMSEAAQMDRVDEISSVPSASVLPSAAEGAVEITSGSEAAKPEKEKALVAPEKSGAFRSRSWLEAQLSTAYLPQILGSFEERTALKFIAELGKQKFDVYYLETEHKGRPWYVVFYGVFPSKKQAQEAIKVAPERIQRQQPWLRRADTVLKSYPD